MPPTGRRKAALQQREDKPSSLLERTKPMYRFHNWLRLTRNTGAPAKRRARLTPQLEILEDRCVPSFIPATYPTADGSQTGAIAAGDLTGNGITDLVMSQGSHLVGVYLGNGDGTFQPAR